VGPGDGDGQRYALAPTLHAETALTLDQLHELLEELAPTEAIAALVAAREYLRERKDTLLREAALALRAVPPRALVREMILAKIGLYNANISEWEGHGGDDERHRRRIKAARAELDQICYRWFGLSWNAVYVPPASVIANGGPDDMLAHVDHEALDEELARRVFGEAVIQHVPAANPSAPQDWANVVIAGSDGSTYSSVMQIDTARAFVDDAGSEVVTFNNAIVYLHMEGENRRRHPSPLYSVPITRSAIDSPTNAGMVMAPFMYRGDGLTEGEYEKMAKCATDVVQWRADERVFLGDAPALGGDGRALPPPRVHLRDGTVTLQERESHHYQRNDPYGEMVRAGVRLANSILQHLLARRQPPVFAGAVKGSQLHLFGTVVNWFIAHGHPAGGVAPIDPRWDSARASLLADNEAMTMLLASIVQDRGDGYFCTFAVARPFHALTDMYRDYEREEPDLWVAKLASRQRDHRGKPMLDSYWKSVDPIEDDPYVRMCEQADYAMFYIGHSAGDPAPLIPRYEFMESLRPLPPDEAARRVLRNIELIVAAIDHTGFTTDMDHNYLSRKRLMKLVPRVIYAAHEYCKALGRRLETELRSMIVANLHRLGLTRRDADDAVRFSRAPRELLLRQLTARDEASRHSADGE